MPRYVIAKDNLTFLFHKTPTASFMQCSKGVNCLQTEKTYPYAYIQLNNIHMKADDRHTLGLTLAQ